MKSLLSVSCLLTLVLGTALVTRADIARPKTSPQNTRTQIYSNLEIIPDAKATNAILQISKSDLKEMQAAIEGSANPSIAASITHSRTRTVIAGVLLFLSISIAGVWLTRSRTNSSIGLVQKTIAVVLLAIATLGVAAIITRGNAGPPPAYRWRNLATALAEGKSTSGPVIIQIVPDDQATGGMKLTIPLKKQNANGEEE